MHRCITYHSMLMHRYVYIWCMYMYLTRNAVYSSCASIFTHRCATNHSTLMHICVYVYDICTCIYPEMQCREPAHRYIHKGVERVTAYSCIHVYIFRICVHFIQKCNVENLLIDIYTQVCNEWQHTHAYIFMIYVHVFMQKCNVENLLIDIYTQVYDASQCVVSSRRSPVRGGR